MRIPFLKKNITITSERYQFIKETRGGSFMLFAGAIYWYVSFVTISIAPLKIGNIVYTYGGILIPIIGFVILKIQNLKMPKKNQYTWLVIFSSLITPFCFPVLILIGKYDMRLVPPAIAIINGAHLLILMWIHLDYIYAIISMIYLIIGITFMFYLQQFAIVYVGLLCSILSTLSGTIIYFTSKKPLKGYKASIRE